MKLIAVVEAYQTLVAIQNSNDLPIGLAWQILDHITEMAPTNARFEEQRKKLADKHGEVDKKNPDIVKIHKKNEEQFKKEFDELSNLEITLNGIKKLSKDDLLKSELKVPKGTSLGSIRPLLDDDKS